MLGIKLASTCILNGRNLDLLPGVGVGAGHHVGVALEVHQPVLLVQDHHGRELGHLPIGDTERRGRVNGRGVREGLRGMAGQSMYVTCHGDMGKVAGSYVWLHKRLPRSAATYA